MPESWYNQPFVKSKIIEEVFNDLMTTNIFEIFRRIRWFVFWNI